MLGRLINRSGRAAPTARSLAVVRIVFGAVGVLSVVRIIGYGWVEELYAGPSRRFSYPGLGWVAPPGVAGTYLLLGVVGLAALAVMVGWRYRPAIVVFVVGFAWIEFVDVTTYLNHYWFMTTLGLIMIVAPMDARFAARRPTDAVGPSRLGVVGAGPRGRRVRVRRARQAPQRLAAARDAAAALAPRPVGPAVRRSGSRTAVDRLRAQLGGRRVRLQHRGVAAVATHPGVGVGGRRGVPRRDVGAVPDRCVPVVDDRRHDDLLRTRLAGSRSRRRCARGDVDRIPSATGALAPVRPARIRSERGSLLVAGVVGAGDRRDPAPAPCDPGRRPMDQRGISVLVERVAHREGRRRPVPGHRAGDRRRLGRDRGAICTRRRSGGRWRAIPS